jgi:hypothetical protein
LRCHLSTLLGSTQLLFCLKFAVTVVFSQIYGAKFGAAAGIYLCLEKRFPPFSNTKLPPQYRL